MSKTDASPYSDCVSISGWSGQPCFLAYCPDVIIISILCQSQLTFLWSICSVSQFFSFLVCVVETAVPGTQQV